MIFRTGRHLVLIAITLACRPVSNVAAQEGTLARAAAKEVVEFLGGHVERQGAKTLAKELAEFGGEAAVRETFEQVAKESGEEGVKNLVRLSRSYGIDALEAAKVAPRVTSTVIDRIAPELAPGALRALARSEERAVLSRLDAELIPGALEAAAKHPGVGAEVVERLGIAGVRATERFNTDAVIQLARSADASRIAALPMAERKSLIAAMAGFIERHPKTVFGAAALGLFVRYKDELLGEKGAIEIGPDGQPVFVPKTGMIERTSNRMLTWVLPVVAAIIGLWGANKLFWSWRWSRVSDAVKSAGLPQAVYAGKPRETQTDK